MKDKRRLDIIIMLLALAVSAALAMSACTEHEETADETQEEPEVTAISTANPLTGVEEGWDQEAAERRIAAFVVENSPDARPQWGMDDPEYSPDIILQGEVEAGITRTLWMYADYTKLPEQIGPMRSARPPYIKFSELFDAIFIHWGRSTSAGSYTGANTIFKRDKVDHIDGDTFKNKCGAFDRDHTRAVASEHTAIVHGDKVSALIKEAKLRTEPQEYTELSFSPLQWLTCFDTASNIAVTYSYKANEPTCWTYDPDDNQYHTDNFRNNLTRDNLLVLFDETEYRDKPNYHNMGYTVTYCNYKLAGGRGRLYSGGLVKDIEWAVEDGKLVLIDTELTARAAEKAEAARLAAEEAAESEDSGSGEAESDAGAEEAQAAEEAEDPVVYTSLRPGKTWIGWISVNNGGALSDDATL